MHIPITKPFFGEEEKQALLQPLETGWVMQGPCVQQFEERFRSFIGAQFAVATSSCTTALHTAVAIMGLQPGDEVIVPAFTWVATPNVVEYMGARPVFCDIDLRTFNIDVRQIDTLITPRTVGIMPVHLFGLCADMQPILDIAQRHGLWVIEDAACALGARYHQQHAGTFGAMGCFSFHPRKSITTGEGGMITTQHDHVAHLARALRDHGVSQADRTHQGPAGFLAAEYNHLGYNYRMTDLQGALGCAQMARAEWMLTERLARARRYDTLLADVAWLTPPAVPDGYHHGYQAYVCLFCPEEPTLASVERLHQWRNAVMMRLERQGIATRPGTHAPVTLGYYVAKYGFQPAQFPQAYLADRLSLTLPLYVQMTTDEQAVVLSALLQAFKEPL